MSLQNSITKIEVLVNSTLSAMPIVLPNLLASKQYDKVAMIITQLESLINVGMMLYQEAGKTVTDTATPTTAGNGVTMPGMPGMPGETSPLTPAFEMKAE